MQTLMSHASGLRFGDLKQLCGLTDGNLSRHLQALREAGLIEIVKKFVRNRPLTTCRMTAEGRLRYADYLATLEQVVRDAAHAAKRDRMATSKSTLPRA
jgi:DNA-binding transcriptional ArsR family regulator